MQTPPPPSAPPGSPLQDLQLPEEYIAPRARLFPGIESIRWYIRRHRPALTEARAIVFHAGRWWIDPQRFDTYVVEAGAREGQRRLAVA